MPKNEWNPLQEVVRLRKSFNELFERSFLGALADDQTIHDHWSPLVDVYQTTDRVVVLAELPGVDQNEVDIEFKSNKLTIRGTRAPARGAGQAVFHRVERQHGPFERTVILQEPVLVDEIEATYEGGILTVVLPLRNAPIEKKIKLNSI